MDPFFTVELLGLIPTVNHTITRNYKIFDLYVSLNSLFVFKFWTSQNHSLVTQLRQEIRALKNKVSLFVFCFVFSAVVLRSTEVGGSEEAGRAASTCVDNVRCTLMRTGPLSCGTPSKPMLIMAEPDVADNKTQARYPPTSTEHARQLNTWKQSRYG